MYRFLLGTWHTNYIQYMPIKVHLVKATVFPVVIYGCEIWNIKKLSTEKLILSNCGVEEDS